MHKGLSFLMMSMLWVQAVYAQNPSVEPKPFTPSDVQEHLRLAEEAWGDNPEAYNRALSQIYGRNGLHYAAVRNDILQLKRLFLSDRTDEIDQKDRSGSTPLMLAVKNGKVGAATILMEEGANPHIRDREGKTAVDYAKAMNHQEMVDILVNGLRPKQ